MVDQEPLEFLRGQRLIINLFSLLVFTICCGKTFSHGISWCDELSGVKRIAPKATIYTQVKNYGESKYGYTFLASDEAMITLKCYADFPVQWVFDDEKSVGTVAQGPEVFNVREYKDFRNVSTFYYRSFLVFFYKTQVKTQIFSCQSVTNPCVRRLFLSKPLENGRKTQVRWEAPLNLPELLQGANSTVAIAHAGESTARDGFKPQCKALFYYGKTAESWAMCCRKNAPDWSLGLLLRDVEITGMSLANLRRNANVQPTSCMIPTGNITADCPPNINSNAGEERLEPTMKTLSRRKSYGISCEGNMTSTANTVMVKVMFSIAQENGGYPEIYFNWKDINPEAMIRINLSNPTLEFVGNNLIVECLFSLTYFSHGGFVAELDSEIGLIHHKDDIAWDTSKKRYVEKYSAHLVRRSILVKNTTEAVYCFGPVWNTSEWINKSVAVVALEPKPMTITGPEQVNWNLGEWNKTLSCHVTGLPISRVSWRFKNKTLKTESFSSLNMTETVSTLNFPEVDRSMEGSYTCWAQNFASDKFLDIQVKVRDAKAIAFISASTAVVLALLLILTICLVSLWRKNVLQRQALRKLTEREIEDFTRGSPNDLLSALQQPYNSEFEIDPKRLIYKPEDFLDKGAFGMVFKGTVKAMESNEKSTTVAVKTVPKDVDIVYLKALLSELKILAFVTAEGHPHVIKLMGACTQNLNQREVFVAIEFCSKGNLQKYLAQYRRKLDNNYENIDWTQLSDTRNSQQLKLQMFKWATEIADGMEFLAAKKVIHGDLAARNILLNDNLESKIADFGLARIQAEPIYVKKKNSECPLPWKWMAIESLEEMTFSEKSDVWAYGILLWEIYSLAQNPYPGVRWTMQFVESLKRGMRCPMPPFADMATYDIMLRCWKKNPADRISFQEAHRAILDNYQTLVMAEKTKLCGAGTACENHYILID